MRSLALAAAALLLVATEAAAADEVTTLETQLGKESSELSTSDCAAACKALASIRRAADRICELEPGPRCDAARSKAENATKKVRDACPECAIAGLKKDEEEDKRAARPEPSPPASPASVETSEPRGGCRNCSTSSGAPERGDFAVFALVALLVARRSRKDRERV